MNNRKSRAKNYSPQTKNSIKTAPDAAKNGVGAPRKTKSNLNGIRFGIWLYFMLFAVCILAVMWFFQFVFAKSYYNGMRMNDVRRLCESSVSMIKANGWEKSKSDLYGLARTNGFNIYLFGPYKQCLYGVDSNGNEDKLVLADKNFGTFHNGKKEIISGVARLSAELKNSPDKTICETIADNNSTEKTAIRFAVAFYGEGGQEFIFYAYVPLFNLASTMSLMAAQLLVVTISALVLSFAAAWLLSAQLSRPIEQMSRSAARLASGDYDVRFAGNGYNEVDELSESLNLTAKELARAETMRKDMIANVGHDLRTPLTLIKSYAEMIRDLSGDNKEKREKHLATIIGEADRLTEMVNNLLVLAKNENATQLKFEVYDLSEQLNKTIDIYADANKKFKFERDIDGGVYVTADKQRMDRVFNNFISNAVKYSGNSTVIRLVLKKYKDAARFDIFDYGIGISQEELPHIWDRYTKASIKHQRGDSNGLGLSIVKDILIKHKAKYGANSVLGKGSDFYFEMPLATKEEKEKAMSEQNESKQPSVASNR